MLGLFMGLEQKRQRRLSSSLQPAGVGGAGTGALVLLLFVLGLLICNSLMSLLVSLGFRSARHHAVFSISLGVVTGVFSSIVGVFFLLGQRYTPACHFRRIGKEDALCAYFLGIRKSVSCRSWPRRSWSDYSQRAVELGVTCKWKAA